VRAVRAAGPYGRAAKGYWDEGWTPLPLPPASKSPPPKGWTGGSKTNSGERPSADQVSEWMAAHTDGNIAIRLPRIVLGIDVDQYKDKVGGKTLAACVERWGELPDTWISTSRLDGSGSGIRWFRIEDGLAWPGQLPGGGVELIRWDHRFAVVAPSIHPETGAEYVWVAPDGSSTTDEDGWEFPAINELPYLPEAWVTGLTEGKLWTPRAEADMTSVEVTDWLKERGTGAECSIMQRTLQKGLQEIRKAGADGGAHDATRDAIWAVVGDAASGHAGIRPALERLMAAFKEAMKDRDPNREWRGEWRRMLEDGVRKVAAEREPDEDDPCDLDLTIRPAKQRNSGSAGMSFERNDAGNGRRFAMRFAHSVRYVPEYQGWFIWSDKVWARDSNGETTRMAIETAESIKQEAEYIEDEKQKAKLLAFASGSANEGKIKSMLGVAKDLRGMTVPASHFDADPHKMVTPTGTLMLPASGGRVRLKPSVLEDYNTLITPVPYIKDARSPEWEKFLARFQPDVEVREWLQKLAGYSLLGRNPKRLMVACYGPTSTGKTTFAKAIQAALGEYAGSTAMTIFRDNQDERSRPDLVRVLGKRFVYAEEASASWHLHPDQIKRLTGGAPITARVPFAKEYMELVPAFTPWLLTNAAPTIEGADAALWRRFLVVPFSEQIPQSEEDAEFEERMLSEEGATAILAWLVEGYQMYLDAPDSIQQTPLGAIEATMEFRADVSDLDRCIADVCDIGEPADYFVLPSQLYSAYIAWCEEHGVKERDRISLIMLGRQLEGKGYKRSSSRKVKGREGKPVPVRSGLRLKEGWEKVHSAT
jgi:P4 family phage/plasmid primase-like protien